MLPISVLMSIYDKEKPEYFSDCLMSLSQQTNKANELILVEDGPINNDLKNIIEKYRNDLKIYSIRLKENVGLARALNEGLKYCSFDLVARMDTDDIACAQRFAKQVSFMKSNPNIVASSGIILEFDDSGRVISKRKLPTNHDTLTEFAKKRSPLSHPSVIFNKNAILSVGGYPELYPEDYMLWIKLIQAGYKIGNTDEILLKMRCGEGFFSRRGFHFLKGEIKIYFYMYETKFISIYELIGSIVTKFFVRLSPSFVKKFLYNTLR